MNSYCSRGASYHGRQSDSSVQAAAWTKYLETCEASGVVDPHRQTIWDVIVSHYTAGSRHYHNLAHVMTMFDFIKRALKAGVQVADAAAVDWAVWFHDVVYDATNSSHGSNEAESAELAGRLLTNAGVAQSCVSKVQQIVLATAAHHHLEGDQDGDLVIDADLSVLGSPLQRYIEYAMAIRREYGHLADEEYTQGRARFLKGLLDREQLYLTDIGKSTCEAAARANMAHEWRLVFAGQLLQANTLEEADTEGTEGSDVASGVGSIGPDAPDLAAAAAAAAAAADQ